MVTTFAILLYAAVLVTVAIIIVNTSSTTKALAYLMLIFLFPIIGLIVYFSVGRNYRINKLYNKKLNVDRHAFPELEKQLKTYSKKTLSNLFPHLKNFGNLARFGNLDNILTIDNEIELLVNGEKKFPDLYKTLNEAKEFIHIQYYIFEEDTVGNKIGEILKKKSKEGVKVRFIYDDYGSRSIRKSFVQDLKANGVQAFPFYKIKLLAFANRMNYRNHRKIIVVDGKIGYVGGINISDRYTNPNSHKLYWRDTHLKITGSAVLILQRVFIADWNFCANQKLGVTEKLFPINNLFNNTQKQVAQIVFSGPDSDHSNILYTTIQAILLAKEEILITTPYFVPDSSLTDALKIARLSKVDVKLIIPGKSDSVIVNATSKSYYKELLEIGVEIYQYQKGFVHAKTMVCDSFVSSVGTANLDQRSFHLNFEINSFIFDKKFSNQLRDVFFEDLKNCTQIELEAWINRPFYVRFFERLVRLMAPLM